LPREEYYCTGFSPALSAHFNRAVAIAAIDGFVAARFKGYLRVFATLRALHWKHLAWSHICVVAISVAASAVSILLRFSCLTARETTLRLISKTLGCEKLLLANGKGEGCPAIGTLE
jgi:hypothetical protein